MAFKKIIKLISVYEDDNSSVLNKLPIKLCTLINNKQKKYNKIQLFTNSLYMIIFIQLVLIHNNKLLFKSMYIEVLGSPHFSLHEQHDEFNTIKRQRMF